MRLLLVVGLFVFPLLVFAQERFVQKQKMYLSAPQVSAKSNLFQESMTIELGLRHPGTIIRYSLNDSIVNEQSLVYDQPLIIQEEGLLSVRAFHPDYLPSKTYRQFFYKASSFTEKPSIKCTPSPKAPYAIGGTKALLNMVKGTKDFRRDKSWLGFQGDTITIDLTFAEPTQLSKLTMSVMQDQGSWIFMPQRAEVWANGQLLGYTNIREAAEQMDAPNATSFISMDLQEAKEKKYLIKVINLPALPAWHPGAGAKPWLFIDELFTSLD